VLSRIPVLSYDDDDYDDVVVTGFLPMHIPGDLEIQVVYKEQEEADDYYYI